MEVFYTGSNRYKKKHKFSQYGLFKFNWENFKATTRKSVSVHVKLEIKCIQTLSKEKFHKQSPVILLKNSCSVGHTWCTTLVSLSVAKDLENLLNGYFYYNYFTSNLSNRYFSEVLFLVSDRIINKVYQRKLKSGNRLWKLEITHWKLRLYEILFDRLWNSHSFTVCH